VTTIGSTTVTSASGAFTSLDRGKYIMTRNLPPRSFITTVSSGTSVVVSQAAHRATTGTAYVSGDLYFANAFYGAVDPATGIYYGVATDASGPGTVLGVFYLPKTGDQMRILDPGGIGTLPFGPSALIAGGYLWVGDLKYPLIQLA
jgi:hypothetical protein